MKVKIHKLFQYLLETTSAEPEAFLGFSLSEAPALGDFLDELDPCLPLDWNGRSFFGLPVLRERVIEQAGLAGICSADHVLITAGAAKANYLAMRQLLEPGDHVVLERPGWPQAEVLARAIGCDITHVNRDEAGAWSLPLDTLGDAARDDTKLIFLTNPNNPSGRLLSTEELKTVASIASRVGAWLLVDEVYAGLEWTAPRAPSIAGLYERGITTGSVSKALGLQGLRTGWMICPDKELRRDAMILRENSSEIMNILGKVIAEIALRPSRLGPALERAREAGAANLELLNAWIDETPELDWHPPEAGLIGLARLKRGDGDALAETLLAPPYKTFLIPGSAYGLPDHIRLGVGGGTQANLEEGLGRLSALFRSVSVG